MWHKICRVTQEVCRAMAIVLVAVEPRKALAGVGLVGEEAVGQTGMAREEGSQ